MSKYNNYIAQLEAIESVDRSIKSLQLRIRRSTSVMSILIAMAPVLLILMYCIGDYQSMFNYIWNLFLVLCVMAINRADYRSTIKLHEELKKEYVSLTKITLVADLIIPSSAYIKN